MKNSLVVIITLLFQNIFPQTGEPVIVNPLGDKIDQYERNFYKLFPDFKNFIDAEYFLNPDSSLNVKIRYEDRGMIRDSLFKNYYKQFQLQNYLSDKLIGALEFHKSDLKEAKVQLLNDEEVTAYLYSVNDTSVYVFNEGKKEFLSINNDQILRILIMNDVSSLPYSIAGCALGGVAGAVIGASVKEEPDKDKFLNFDELFSSLENGCIGGIIGSLIGLIAGTALGKTATEITDYSVTSDGCFCQLAEYTILTRIIK